MSNMEKRTLEEAWVEAQTFCEAMCGRMSGNIILGPDHVLMILFDRTSGKAICHHTAFFENVEGKIIAIDECLAQLKKRLLS